MMARFAALALGVLILMAGCAKHPEMMLDTALTPDEIISLARQRTPELCGYKGRVSVKTLYDGEDIAFNALLDKGCNDNISMKVLGAFNTVAGDISYSDKGLRGTIIDQGGSYLADIANVYIVLLLKFLNTPVILPDLFWQYNIGSDGYRFSYNKESVIIDSDFMVSGYNIDDKLKVTYVWNENTPDNIKIDTELFKLDIKFQKDKWISDNKTQRVR